MGTISTKINPALYIELDLAQIQSGTVDGGGTFTAGAVVSVAPRPGTAGLPIQVRDAITGDDLPPATLDAQGFLPAYFAADALAFEFSTDGWLTVLGPYMAAETVITAALAGVNANTALTNSTEALAAAQDALRLVQENPGGTGGGPITIAGVTGVTFTLAQIHARDDRVPISINDVNAPMVAKTGLYSDLLQKPAVATLVNGKVPASQLPVTGTFGDPILQKPDGTYPARNTVTQDETRSVFYRQLYTAAEPTRGTDGASAYAPNPALNIPGDFLIVGGAL